VLTKIVVQVNNIVREGASATGGNAGGVPPLENARRRPAESRL
jgi:hypothetical protein